MLKNDKLDALIMLSGDVLIKKNCDLFESTDTSDVVRPKSLDRRVQRTINRENRKKEYGDFYKYAKAFVAALLIICTVSFAAVMSVDAIRGSLWDAIFNFYKDFFGVVFEEHPDAPKTIEIKREPTLIPAEWEKRVINDSEYFYSIRYMYEGKLVLKYTQLIKHSEKQLGDSESIAVNNVKVEKYKGVIFEYEEDKRISLKWGDDEYYYSLTTDVEAMTIEQLIKIAESVYSN